jgi:hypothetical protein
MLNFNIGLVKNNLEEINKISVEVRSLPLKMIEIINYLNVINLSLIVNVKSS